MPPRAARPLDPVHPAPERWTLRVHQLPPTPADLRVKIGRHHDVDLEDAKFGREEAAGVGQLVAGIAAAHADDEARLARGAALFDDLHAGLGAAPPRGAP